MARVSSLLAISLGASLSGACDAPPPDLVPVTHSELQRAGELRVFFAHQSVGADVLAGLTALGWDTDSTLRIRDARLGRNEDPRSKIDAFSERIRGPLGDELDVALLKLCYVDFSADTDVPALFAYYRDTLAALQRARPDLRFVHVTTPLTTTARGPRAWLAQALSRPVWGERENARRHEYNELIRTQLGADAVVYDLASVETAGAPTPALHRALTTDGGHLNAVGRRRAATQLVRVLATLAEPNGGAT
jgi:hypothetical protein